MDVVGGLTIKNSIFNGNRPVIKAGVDCKNGDGAAIHVQGGVGATIDKSTFINNVGATGAVTLALGELTITNSTFAYNKGVGGQYNWNGTGAISMQGSTRMGTRLTVENSTITNNVAFRSGGGIGGTLTLKNTIIANNTAPYGAPDCFGGDSSGLPPGEFVPSPPVSQGNNIFGSVSGCYVVLAATDFVGSPGLAAMATDATTGQTYFPLLANSQAIDRAADASCSAYDQLGKPRPIDGNNDGVAQCDIGAFEKQPAQVANVCPSGCAYSSIQAALDAAVAGSTVTVGPGTYNEAVRISNSKTLLSTQGPQSTILNGAALSVITVSVGIGSAIDGFTIENNPLQAIYSNSGIVLNNIIRNNGNITTGLGAFYTNRSGSIIKNNTFINNKGQSGGAITTQAYSGTLITIENNTFLNNSSGYASAIFLNGSYTSPSSISKNVFKGNVSNVGAPVIWVGGYGNDPLIANNLIVENTGSAIHVVEYSKARTINNTIVGNSGGGVSVPQYGTLTVDNSIIRGNSIYDVRGGWYAQVFNSILGPNSYIWGGSVNNSYADPMFVGAGDYRVRAGSPAIDRGKNMASSGVVTDLLGVARPQDGDKLGAGSTGDGSDYDIGAYEFK